MPNLGPGVPQNLNPAVTPTWVFTPTPGVNTSFRISNNGGNTVYIGGANVSQYNGIPLAPGCRPVELQNCPFTVYTCSGVSLTGATKVSSATAITAGSTGFTLTTSGQAVGPAVLGNGTSLEVVNISVSSTTVVTLS